MMLFYKKYTVYILLTAILLLAGCGNLAAQPQNKSVNKPQSGKLSLNKKHKFTLTELSKYNGRNGRSAYIAVKGMVYDVTHAPDWHNGSHHGVQAGQDLTAAIESAPHGASVLAAVPIVGYLTKDKNAVTKTNNSTTNSSQSNSSKNNRRTFTLVELKKYNGQNGQPAYVAVKGKVYDVTHASGWHNGRHHGVQAGQDLTAAIESAPHGTSVLSAVPVIGYLTKNKNTATKTNNSTKQSSQSNSNQSNKRTLTLAELKKYNGQNGQPAYVAVKGKVYDVTHAPGWHNGRHHGVQAGQDLTAAIESAPHGTSVLSSLTVVGYLK
jgi:predicted heme/steroid binding protein